MKPRTTRLGTLLLAGGMMTGCGGAAAPDAEDSIQSLGAPTGVLADDFGAILSVRERADGTVLVPDPLGARLYLVDFTTGSRVQVGSEGQGPEEYLQPDAVWPLPGDSTLLVDLGNGRMVALGPENEFGPTTPLSAGDPRTGMVIAIPLGIDDSGAVYARSMGGGMGELPDSGSVLRVDREALTTEDVARFKLPERRTIESGSANDRSVRLETVPLSGEDSWGVASDGSVVVVRSSDYHVDWFAPDGTVISGPPTPFQPVPIGTAEKEEWVRAQSRAGGGLSVMVEINNGSVQLGFRRGGGGEDDEPDIDGYAWPDVKPPFETSRVSVDGMDRAWVRRSRPAGAEAFYDVFDRSGARVATFSMPWDRRIVSFGEGTIYVVRNDDFDLSYLERYALPPM